MSKKILIINSGSSSLKYLVYDLSNNEICNGICERIFIDGIFKFKNKQTNQNEEFEKPFPDHGVAIDFLMNYLKEKKIIDDANDILGVGHRVVQGGTLYKNSVIVDKEVEANIEKMIPLAPLHNKPAIDVIKIMGKKFPSVKSVAVFDTSFHTTMQAIATTYAVPKEWREKHHVRRYGMHGISYRYIVQKYQAIAKKDKVNLIVCHLGNGASMCAIENNHSIHTTMGLTPLAGLIMGTRCGDIDPSIHKYIGKALNKSIDEIDEIMCKQSGLLGLCGSSDFRDLLKKYEAKDSDAILTIDLFIQKIVDYIAMYTNLLKNKVDAIVFTAGIGENTPLVIEKAFERFYIQKYEIDQAINKQSYDDFVLVTKPNSPKIYKIRTNEELMIATDVKNLLGK